MKAVLVTGRSAAWMDALGVPWPLLPFGNRLLIEYWFELCLDVGIREIVMVLGDGAAAIEAAVGDGARWGLTVSYSFLRYDRAPLSFLHRTPERWRDGLLFLAAPMFPRRRGSDRPAPVAGSTYATGPAESPVAFMSTDPAYLSAFLETGAGAHPPAARPFSELGVEPALMEKPRDFFDTNMRLVSSEWSRYVTSGYHAADGSMLGYNVVVSPSARLAPPIVVGNDCHIGALASVGPRAVVGHRVIIDRQSDLADCVILDGTYIGRGLEIHGKIVAGTTLMDPDDGVALRLEDPLLLDAITSRLRWADVARGAAGWVLAVLLALVQAVPFVLLAPLLVGFRVGRLTRRHVYGPGRCIRRTWLWTAADNVTGSLLQAVFRGLSLDLFPCVMSAVLSRLWLCGHDLLRAPEDQELRASLTGYFPAAFSYSGDRESTSDPKIRRMEAFYYERHHSLREDVAILWRSLFGRLANAFAGRSAE